MVFRLRVFSDLHTEFAPVELPRTPADLVLLAGDIGKGRHGVEWAQQTFPETPVVYVAGNHEFYGGSLPDRIEEMRAAARGTQVRVMEREECRVGPFRILATTLWTDFGLFGSDTRWASQQLAAASMSDYTKIRTGARTVPGPRKLRPADTRLVHSRSRQWLREKLGQQGDWGGSIVVSHHAPSPRSLAPRFANDSLAPAYASRLDQLVEGSGATLWVHGHTHHNVDYEIGSTRVFSNQRGYPDERLEGFSAQGLLELRVD